VQRQDNYKVSDSYNARSNAFVNDDIEFNELFEKHIKSKFKIIQIKNMFKNSNENNKYE
jgi:hypothetical protein